MSKKNNTIRECGRLFSYAKPHWKMFFLTLLCMGLFTLFIGAQLALIKPVIDRMIKGEIAKSSSVIDNIQKKNDSKDIISSIKRKTVSRVKGATFISKFEKSFNSFTFIGVLVAIMAPFIFAFNYLQTYLKNHVMWSVLMDIRNHLCEHILPQSLSYFENRKSGELISRLTNDINATQFGLSILFDSILLQPMRLVCGFGLAFYFSWKLSMFTFVLFPIIVIPVLVFGRKIKKYGRRSLTHLGELTDAMREMFSGIRTVKAFKMEDEEFIEFKTINSRFFKRMMQTVKAKALNASTTEFIYSLGLAAIIIVGGYVISSKTISPGSLGGFVTVTAFLILTSIKNWRKAMESFRNLFLVQAGSSSCWMSIQQLQITLMR